MHALTALASLAVAALRLALVSARLLVSPPRTRLVIDGRPTGSIAMRRRAVLAMLRPVWSEVGAVEISLSLD